MSKYIISIAIAATLASSAMAQKESWMQRDSVIATQFGDVLQSHNSSAMSSVKGEKLQKSFTQNVMNTLYGEIPGLTVMQGSGEPGSDSPTLNARGIATFGGSARSSRDLLIIVDGFESTLEQLTVQEIESVTLLKDAAATVIYGMKGANGVLLVTTKRGRISPLEVNFSAQVGLNMARRMPEFLNSYDYAMLYNEARVNDGLPPYYTQEALAAYQNHTDPALYPDVNCC